jgi:hypothetical protein
MSGFNKKYYPLSIKFVKENEGYLIEEAITEEATYVTQYIPCHKTLSVLSDYIYLYISHLRCDTYIENDRFSEKLRGVASLFDDNDSISFFGSKNKIRKIRVMILQTEEDNNTGFIFDGYLKDEYDDYESEEFLEIRFALNIAQFQELKYLINKKLIRTVDCSIGTDNIDGLYKADTLAPWSEYKVLHNRAMVKNVKDLPTSFKDLTTGIHRINDFSIRHYDKICELDEDQEEFEPDQNPTVILHQNIAQLSSVIKYCCLLLICIIVQNIFRK